MDKLPVLAVSALLLLAGCSALPTGADFETTVDAEYTTMVGDEYTVDVTAENNGSAADEYTAELTVNGEVVDNASATIDPDGDATLQLSHTFDESGEYTITVADEEYSLVVVDPSEVLENHTAVTSYSVTESLEVKSTSDSDEAPRTLYAMSTHATYDLEDEAAALETHYESDSETLSVHSWYVDGTAYQKIGAEDPMYDTTPLSWDETRWAVSPSTYLTALAENGASVEYGGGATTYSADLGDEDVIEAVTTVLDEEHKTTAEFSFETQEITEFNTEVIVDEGYVTRIDLELAADSPSANETKSIDLTLTYDNYNDAVTISVPEEVRENT